MNFFLFLVVHLIVWPCYKMFKLSCKPAEMVESEVITEVYLVKGPQNRR